MTHSGLWRECEKSFPAPFRWRSSYVCTGQHMVTWSVCWAEVWHRCSEDSVSPDLLWTCSGECGVPGHREVLLIHPPREQSARLAPETLKSLCKEDGSASCVWARAGPRCSLMSQRAYLSDTKIVETILDKVLGVWSSSRDHIGYNSKSLLQNLLDTDSVFLGWSLCIFCAISWLK